MNRTTNHTHPHRNIYTNSLSHLLYKTAATSLTNCIRCVSGSCLYDDHKKTTLCLAEKTYHAQPSYQAAATMDQSTGYFYIVQSRQVLLSRRLRLTQA